jgi:hypothetical protein
MKIKALMICLFAAFFALAMQFQRPAIPAEQQVQYIGTAVMSADGTVTLNLRAQKGAITGRGTLHYRRGDAAYVQIIQHLGGLEPGQSKLVQPWPDTHFQGAFQLPEAMPAQMSPDFARRVNDEVARLPESIKTLLAKSGVRIVPSETIVEELPELKGEHPRGWPPDTTWDAVDGVHDPGKKLVVIAEKTKIGNDWVDSKDTEGLVRHEVGHAVDAALGDYSSSQEFIEAYNADVAVLPNPAPEELKYFLQDGEAGREETFAEAMAIVLGGPSRPKLSVLETHFPRTMALVRKKVSELK